MEKDVCDVYQKMNDERFARDKERLDKIEELTAKISECNIQLSEVVKAYNEKLIDHEKRLDEIEHQPKAWMDKIFSGVIAAIVSFVMGVVLK